MLLSVLLLTLLLFVGSGCNRTSQTDNADQTSAAPAQGVQSARSSASLADQRDLPGNGETRQEADGDDGDGAAAESDDSEDNGDEDVQGDQEDENGEEAAEGEEGDESAGEDEGNGGDEGGEEAGPEDEDQQPETGDESGEDNGGEEAEPPRQPDPSIDAAAIYRIARCGQCHGDEFEGTQSGPPLLNMGDYWNADDLALFLRSPMTYVEGNQRLINMGRNYPVIMPPTHRNDEELFALAWWLIEPKVEETAAE